MIILSSKCAVNNNSQNSNVFFTPEQIEQCKYFVIIPMILFILYFIICSIINRLYTMYDSEIKDKDWSFNSDYSRESLVLIKNKMIEKKAYWNKFNTNIIQFRCIFLSLFIFPLFIFLTLYIEENLINYLILILGFIIFFVIQMLINSLQSKIKNIPEVVDIKKNMNNKINNLYRSLEIVNFAVFTNAIILLKFSTIHEIKTWAFLFCLLITFYYIHFFISIIILLFRSSANLDILMINNTRK